MSTPDHEKFSLADLIIVLAVLLLAFLLNGCQSTKPVAPTPTIPVESVIEREIVHDTKIDTMIVFLPMQSSDVIVRDSTSVIENDYAKSWASILPDGFLRHSLTMKRTPVSVPVKSTSDTIKVKEYIEKPVNVPVPYPVEKALTPWQSFRLQSWSWMAAIICLSVLWIFRDPIISFIRRIARLK